MYRFGLIFVIVALVSGCSSVIPIEPAPENLTLVEAERVIKNVMTQSLHHEKTELTDYKMTFVDHEQDSQKVSFKLGSIYNMKTKRGFVRNGYYSHALVTVYYRDTRLDTKKFSVDCRSLKEATSFMSAMKKLSEYARKNHDRRLAELKRAYKNGILSREEYLTKKEKMAQKLW